MVTGVGLIFITCRMTVFPDKTGVSVLAVYRLLGSARSITGYTKASLKLYVSSSNFACISCTVHPGMIMSIGAVMAMFVLSLQLCGCWSVNIEIWHCLCFLIKRVPRRQSITAQSSFKKSAPSRQSTVSCE